MPGIFFATNGINLLITSIYIGIAPEELINKITILKIKLDHIEDYLKLANVRIEDNIFDSKRQTYELGDHLFVMSILHVQWI